MQWAPIKDEAIMDERPDRVHVGTTMNQKLDKFFQLVFRPRGGARERYTKWVGAFTLCLNPPTIRKQRLLCSDRNVHADSVDVCTGVEEQRHVLKSPEP